MHDLNEILNNRKQEELNKKNALDILGSIMGAVILYLIWHYWNHTVAGCLFVYSMMRNHGYSHIILLELLKRKN